MAFCSSPNSSRAVALSYLAFEIVAWSDELLRIESENFIKASGQKLFSGLNSYSFAACKSFIIASFGSGLCLQETNVKTKKYNAGTASFISTVLAIKQD